MSLDLSVRITRKTTANELMEQCESLLKDLVPIAAPQLEWEVRADKLAPRNPAACELGPSAFLSPKSRGGAPATVSVVEVPAIPGYEDSEIGLWAGLPQAIALTPSC